MDRPTSGTTGGVLALTFFHRGSSFMRVLIGLALALGVVSCGGSDKAPTTPPTPTNKTYDIFTIGDSFSPFSQTIAANDTIRWNFAGGSDGLGHNVRFFPKVTGAPADIPVQKSGSLRTVFTAKGDFKYVCDVHPGMAGEIIVQ